MQRRTPVLATAAAVLTALIGFAPADAAVPDITSISVSNATIYPLVASTARPGSTEITINGDYTTVDHLEIRNSAATNVRTLYPTPDVATWNGRSTTNTVVPAGAYTVVAIGTGSDVSPVTATITVSGKKLIAKTYTRTVTAAGTLVDKYVGKCSTLRKPSKRGWAGSLGFYSNTKCASRTFEKAGVLSIHALRLPAAESYSTVRVNLYGGAAKAHKTSRGVLLYLDKTEENAYGTVTVTSKLGNHFGKVRTGTNMVASNGRFVWSFATAAPQSKYDVKNFTVVVHYTVLG